MRTPLGILTLAWWLIAAPSWAATYYVSQGAGGTPSGDNARSCATAQTITTPKLTINAGVACLIAGAPGDEVLVRGGTYQEAILDPPLTGTNFTTGKYRIAAYPSETVRIFPQSGEFVFNFAGTQAYIEIDGFIIDGSLVTVNTIKIEAYTIAPSNQTPSHIRIQNSEIIGNTTTFDGACIQLVSAGAGTTGFNQILNNTIHACGESAGDLPDWGIYLQSADNTLDGNTIYDAPGGIQLYNGYGNTINNTVITRNIIRDLRATPAIPSDRHSGITVYNAGTNNLIANNIIYGVPASTAGSISAGVYVGITGTGLGIYNNTIVDNSGKGIFCESATAPTVTNNLLVSNVGSNFDNACSATGSNNVTTGSGGFTNQGAHDYTLAIGSQAIDFGTPVGAVATDILGVVARPQGSAYDAGAYERLVAGGNGGTISHARQGLRRR